MASVTVRGGHRGGAAAIGGAGRHYAGAVTQLSLAEWVSLTIIDEKPTHGFAISALTAPTGELGRIWQIPKPVVYRALGHLRQRRLIEVEGVEQRHGPQRQLHRATPAGSDLVSEWLAEPVRHVRDLRSHLLLKLALQERRGQAHDRLIRAQQDALVPILTAYEAREESGFDAILAAWRRANTRAAVEFLDEIIGIPAV